MPSTVQRLGYEGTKAVLPRQFWLEGHALWEMTAKDEYGNITKHAIGSNLLTDAGATSILKMAYSTSTTVAPFQYAVLEKGTASTATTGSSLSTGSPITSIPVAALLAGSSIALNQPITLISGSNAQTIYATASASAGATSVSVASAVGGANFTPNFAYPGGTLVIPQPMFTDNPTSIPNGVYVSIASGSFVYNGGNPVSTTGFTGQGARTVTFRKYYFCRYFGQSRTVYGHLPCKY